MKVSAIIPAKNEANDLPRLIKSLAFADEVIIIDTGSTDRTIQVAQELGARVAKEDFSNFADIRNLGAQLAKNDWILSLDADTEVTPQLADEINRLPDTPAAYQIGRVNIIWGRPILHADWGPADDCHIRLYNRQQAQFQGRVHEQVTTQAPVKLLRGRLNHYNYSSVAEYVTKLNFYSDLEAQNRHQSGQSFSWASFFGEPLYDFGKRYFYKLGFLEGWHGLFLSMLQAIFYMSVNIKLVQLEIRNQ